MKDRIIGAFLKDFTAEFSLGYLDEAEAFEQFVNYCVVSKHHPDDFEPGDVSVGGAGDLGLDGIAILINDHLAFSSDDVDHLKMSLRRLDAQFIFVQAKTSPRFEAADIGTFIAEFGSSATKLNRPRQTTACSNYTELRNMFLIRASTWTKARSADSTDATTGAWKNEASIVERIEQGKRDLEQTTLFVC